MKRKHLHRYFIVIETNYWKTVTGSYKIKIQLADIKANINANPGFSLYYTLYNN